MEESQRLLQVLPSSVQFVDHKQVNWPQVRHTHYWMYQRFRYEYPGPIRDLHQRLMVIPPDAHGSQFLSGHKLRVTASEVSVRYDSDQFGNKVCYLDLPHVSHNVDFEIWSSVERKGNFDSMLHIPDYQAEVFYNPTHLTNPDDVICGVAQELAAETADAWQLADKINSWVYNHMRYAHGVTNVGTPAAEALRLGQGLCQDYSHIMLAICRAAGLAARYVSGHLLGEGGSHAWVEVLLPAHQGHDLVAVAFDPTNHCRAGANYITVAVGRDYRDVSPTSGYFTAPYQGRLTASKQAGLVRVEYHDGKHITVDISQFEMNDALRRIA